MNPENWTTNKGGSLFIMAKLTREQKIEIYHKKKSGVSNSSLSKQYGIAESGIRYLIKLIDEHW